MVSMMNMTITTPTPTTFSGTSHLLSIPLPNQPRRIFFTSPKLHASASSRLCISRPSCASSSSSQETGWSVGSWRTKTEDDQLPNYDDPDEKQAVCKFLERGKSFGAHGRCTRKLEGLLGEAAMGNAFLLHYENCDESRETRGLLLQMSDALMCLGRLPAIMVARLPGEYYDENLNIFNVHDFIEKKVRITNPHGKDPYFMLFWGRFRSRPLGIEDSYNATMLKFEDRDHLNSYLELKRRGYRDFWMSHECLLLPFEEPFTKKDSKTGLYYDGSGHMLCVEENALQLDGAHVEFLRGVSNPLGIKVSDKMDPDELVKLVDILNPTRKPGRITVITQMGVENTRVKLPHLIRAVRDAKQLVIWVVDPMHKNTVCAPTGANRCFDAIMAEVRAFFDVHFQEGSHPGGIQLDLGGKNHDDQNSSLHCDSRLDASQNLELVVNISELFRERRLGTKFSS